MDRIFYSIEQWNDGKMIHVFGEIYQFGSGEEKDYRLAQFAGAYLDIEDIEESSGKFMELIYNDGDRIYESDMTKAEAEECCKTYFGGKSGTELDINECDEDTPCGDYWCGIGAVLPKCKEKKYNPVDTFRDLYEDNAPPDPSLADICREAEYVASLGEAYWGYDGDYFGGNSY